MDLFSFLNTMTSTTQKQLLSIIEVGGYPNFSSIYEAQGYQVTVLTTMRKVLKYLKKHTPDMVVAEFNFQSDFRDRTSSLESLMSMIERMPNTKVIVFYDKEFKKQLARLEEHYHFHATLSFPIDVDDLQEALIV